MSLVAHMPLTNSIDISQDLINNACTGSDGSGSVNIASGSPLGEYCYFNTKKFEYWIPQLIGSKQISVSFWANFEELNSDGTLFHKLWGATAVTPSGGNQLFRVESTYWTNGKAQFSIYNNGMLSTDGYLMSNTFELHKWQHVVYTLEVKANTSVASLYVDGKFISSEENPIVSSDHNVSFNGHFQIGDSSSIAFNIVDFKVYNHVLSQDEIDALQEVDATISNSSLLTFVCRGGWEIIGKQLPVKANTSYILSFNVKAPNFYFPDSEGTGLRVHILHSAPNGSSNLKSQTNFAYYDIAPNFNGKVEIPFTCTDRAYVAINGGYVSDNQTVSFIFENMALTEVSNGKSKDLGCLSSWIKYYNGQHITANNLSGNIAIKDDKGYLIAPGSMITNVPCNAENSYSSGDTRSSGASYTYISKLQKGTPGNSSNYYISDINSGLIKNLYRSKTINVGGTSTTLLYRRYTKMYWGFVVGRGGSRGSNGQYMADVRSGGGGGGAGTILFWLSVASDNTPSFSQSESYGTYTYTISCDGYSITLKAYSGSDGGGGSSSCNGGPGGGGSGGGTWWNIGGITSTASGSYCAQYGPFYICVLARAGTGGADGGTWGGEGTASTNSVTINGSLRTQIGLSSDISWSRQDGQGGAAICPRINGTWYGSQGQGGGTGVHEYTYPL